MPLSANQEVNDCVGSSKALDKAKELVDALIQAVACHRQLASGFGSCADGPDLRSQLWQKRKQAQDLAVANRQHLTTSLRSETLPTDKRLEMELLWIFFSSSLELFLTDMCKVFDLSHSFSSCKSSTFVQTGIQAGPTPEVAGRCLSLPDFLSEETLENVQQLQNFELEVEIFKVDQMIGDMEQKVNVLRWAVGAQENHKRLSIDSASLSGVEEEQNRCCGRSQILFIFLLCGTATMALVLSICVIYLS